VGHVLYIYMYTTHTHTHTYIYIYIYNIYIYIYTYVYIDMYGCKCIYIYSISNLKRTGSACWSRAPPGGGATAAPRIYIHIYVCMYIHI